MRPAICTASGLEFDPFHPDPERIRIEDIAHALAACNRFAGHTYQPYSVAQHSWDVSMRLIGTDAAVGLLHDAAEAYLGDIPAPIKQHVHFRIGGAEWSFKDVEANLLSAIFVRFGLDGALAHNLPLSVKRADHAAYEDERASLMPEAAWWPMRAKPRDLQPQCRDGARNLFLNRFRALVKRGYLKECAW